MATGLLRHEALRPLSRRHRDVLGHARDLRLRVRALEEGDGERKADAVERFVAFARGELREHFLAEEIILLPAARAAMADPWSGDVALLDRIVRSHRRIREIAWELDILRDPGPERILAAADLLYEYVRDSERHAFPAIETALGPAGLAAMAARLDARVI